MYLASKTWISYASTAFTHSSGSSLFPDPALPAEYACMRACSVLLLSNTDFGTMLEFKEINS